MSGQSRNYYDAFDAVYRESWGPFLHHGWFDGGHGTRRPAVALQRYQDEIVARLRLVEGGQQALCDVGCGYGAFAAELVRRNLVAEAVAITDSRAQVDHARRILPRLEGFRMEESDWLDNQLPAHSYDRVIAIESLYHFEGADKATAIAEISRVLSQGGLAAVALWLRRDRSFLSSAVDRGMSVWGGRFGSLATGADYCQWFAEHDLDVAVFDDVTRFVMPTIPSLLFSVLSALWTEPAAFSRISRSPVSAIRAGVALAFTWLGYSSGHLRYAIVELRKR
ncbi:MAG: methyltransferase domain-containing protein [Verrucomicrobiae bacterium]|nr:methyltransferase domain-containing protein [Verrucomicrobiae bacterium]